MFHIFKITLIPKRIIWIFIFIHLHAVNFFFISLFPLTFSHSKVSFTGSSVAKNPPARQKMRETQVQEDSPGEGNGNPLQYSCLRSLMDRGAWWATFRGLMGVRHNLATKQQA